MPPTTEAIEVAPQPAPPPHALCDRPECNAPAVFSYAWDWGESGVCCAKHQVELAQLQKTLKRSCQFVAIAPNAAPPMQREERVRLKAEAFALEEELGEAKARGLELYRQNTLLAQQVQALRTRQAEAEAQLKDARDDQATQAALADRLAAENADLADEVDRLKILLPREPPSGDTQPGHG